MNALCRELRIWPARVRAWLGLPVSAARLTCACTCHWVPVWAPGTAEEPMLAPIRVGSWGASVRAKVPSGMIATFAGGCAGAGPSCGLSGWKRRSGAVTSATPPTRKRRGAPPGLLRIATVSPIRARSVAASCWSSTTWPGRSEPRRKRNVSKPAG